MKEEKKGEVVEQPRTNREAPAAAKKPFPIGGIIAIAAVVAVLTGFIGFASGVQFQKVATHNDAADQPAGPNGTGGFRARGRAGFRGTFGEVTATTDSSITVATSQRFNSSTNSSTATTQTFTINGSTTITVDGAIGKASDIKIGDQVVVTPSTSDAKVASAIRVGVGGPGMQQSSDSNSTDTTTRTN